MGIHVSKDPDPCRRIPDRRLRSNEDGESKGACPVTRAGHLQRIGGTASIGDVL
jgi:hypothetical protein